MRTDVLPRQEQTAICRAVLESLSTEVRSLQTDIPGRQESEWEPETAQAATELRRLSKNPHPEYTEVGWIESTPRTWDAFKLVAPYAFSAGAMDTHGRYFISLFDEGGMALHLTPHQLAKVKVAVAPDRLVRIPPDAPAAWDRLAQAWQRWLRRRDTTLPR